MDTPPKTVLITLFLILLMAAVWLIFALTAAFGGISAFTVSESLRWVMAAPALGCSIALVITAIFLKKRNRLAFYFGLVMLMMVAVLSITDQIGWLDIFSLLISLVPLVLMLKDRKWYLRPTGQK
jgi:accessory gene regulator protein AgrB